MAKYYVEYGCYLEKHEYIVETDMHIDKINERAYQESKELTEGWLGQHGFLCDCYDEDTEELSWGRCCQDTIEDACFHMVTFYDLTEHGNQGHEEVTW